jgi:hypothetical protein
MNELASAASTAENRKQEDRTPVVESYEPPSLISLGEFGETTLGQGKQYSDDGTKML